MQAAIVMRGLELDIGACSDSVRGLEWPQSPAGLDIGAGRESDERASVAGRARYWCRQR